jgi:hypothetical protein
MKERGRVRAHAKRGRNHKSLEAGSEMERTESTVDGHSNGTEESGSFRQLAATKAYTVSGREASVEVTCCSWLSMDVTRNVFDSCPSCF